MMLPVAVTLLVLVAIVVAQLNEALYQTLKNQTEVIKQLQKDGYVSSEKVMKAMSQFDIKCFEGIHIYLPLYAYILERLEKYMKEDDKVLNVEPGSGYLAACMAEMVGKDGYVVASSESYANLDYPQNVLWNFYRELIHRRRILLVENDGNLIIAFAPYTAIYVGEANQELVPPKVFALALEKLQWGGRLMTPIKSENGNYKMRIYQRNMKGKTSYFEEPGVFEKIHYPKL